MRNFWQSLSIGVQRRWQRSFASLFSVLGVIWLLTEILTRVSKDTDAWLDANGGRYLGFAICSAILGFLIAAYEPRSVRFTIPNTGTKLSLKFANIFDQDADWLIGVNEFFDSTIGDVVSVDSLHGQVISKIYNGNSAEFRSAADSALVGKNFDQVERELGHNKRYALGTTINVPRGNRKIYLVAISKTDTVTHRSSSTVPILWDALAEAFSRIDSVGNGAPLALPLIGNGRASLNIPPQHLLRLVTLRLTDMGKKYDLPREITICLSDDCFEHLDLVEIRRGWSIY